MRAATLANSANSGVESEACGSGIVEQFTIGDPPGDNLVGTPAVVEGTTTAGDSAKQITYPPGSFPSGAAQPAIFPSGSALGGVLAGAIGGALGNMKPAIHSYLNNAKPKEEVIQERLAEYSPEQIREFIRSNRKTITNLEEIIVNLLTDANLMSYEVLKPLMVAKNEGYKMIEHALHVLAQRCTAVDDPEPRAQIRVTDELRKALSEAEMSVGGVATVSCRK